MDCTNCNDCCHECANPSFRVGKYTVHVESVYGMDEEEFLSEALAIAQNGGDRYTQFEHWVHDVESQWEHGMIMEGYISGCSRCRVRVYPEAFDADFECTECLKLGLCGPRY